VSIWLAAIDRCASIHRAMTTIVASRGIRAWLGSISNKQG